jgi:hypothetical protein
MSEPGLLDRFRRQYRGSWRPEDALAWLEDPAAPGPSGAPGPAAELDRMRRELYRRSPGAAATVRRHDEAAEHLAAELAVAREAFRTAFPATPDERVVAEQESESELAPTVRARRRGWVPVVLGCAVAAGVGVALIAPRATPRPPADPELAFEAPATPGTPVWNGHGVGSLPSSPVLEAPQSPVVVTLACRGRGAIHVLVDQQDRRVVCVAGHVRQDIEYFVGHHGRFTVVLSASAPVAWVLTVTAVVVE